MSDATDHFAEAQEWLRAAQRARTELVDLHETPSPAVLADEVDDNGKDQYERRGHWNTMFESAVVLAREHRELAMALWFPEHGAPSAPAAVTATMDQRITEQLAADAAAHQSATLRPGVDDEPPAAGELWTFAEPDDAAGEWFWYALDDIPEDESALGKGYARKNRWLFVQHYAQVLRWQSEKVGGGTIPIPHTWGEIGHDTDGETVLRRPTTAERARFYGPEPDPQPAIVEQHERTTTIPAPPTLGEAFRTPYAETSEFIPGTLSEFTDRAGTSLAELSGEELRALQEAIARRIPVVEGRQAPAHTRPGRGPQYHGGEPG